MKARVWMLVLVLLCLAGSVASCGVIVCQVEYLRRPEPGVRVVLEPGGTVQTTDAAGRCKFPGLAEGRYDLRVTKMIRGVLHGAVADEVPVAAGLAVRAVTLGLTPAIELSRYLPFAVGYQWQYRETIAEGGAVVTKTRREKGVGTEVIGGDTTVVLAITHSPAGDERKEYVRTASDGHTRYREASAADTINYVPPMHFDNLWPLGHTAKVECTMHHDAGSPDQPLVMEGKFVAFENVTVPAGTFGNCARLEFTQRVGSQTRLMTLWLARNVGIVQTVEREPGKEYKRALEEYKVGPPVLTPLLPAPRPLTPAL